MINCGENVYNFDKKKKEKEKRETSRIFNENKFYDNFDEIERVLKKYHDAYKIERNNIFNEYCSSNEKENNAFARKEMNDLEEEFKNLKRDIRDAEKRISNTEKRIYTSNKDMEARINKNLDDLKYIFKDYKQDIKESNQKIEENINKLENKIENLESKLENKIDNTNKWIIGLCISTIVGIAAMVITVVLK